MGKLQIFTKEFHWEQTHLKLQSDNPDVFESAKSAVLHSRSLLEQYIITHPIFGTLLEPIEVDLSAPEFIRNMMAAGIKAGVGPMASVAGGLAEISTAAMMKIGCKLALAENGGDISIKGNQMVIIGASSGENSIAKQMGFKIKPKDMPIGVCTSAGSVGHSISLGDADAVIVFSSSAFLSDAAATSIANVIKSTDPEGSIQKALECAESIEGINGCVAICGGFVGICGRTPEMVQVLDSDV